MVRVPLNTYGQYRAEAGSDVPVRFGVPGDEGVGLVEGLPVSPGRLGYPGAGLLAAAAHAGPAPSSSCASQASARCSASGRRAWRSSLPISSVAEARTSASSAGVSGRPSSSWTARAIWLMRSSSSVARVSRLTRSWGPGLTNLGVVMVFLLLLLLDLHL